MERAEVKKRKKRWRGVWDKEKCKEFKQRLGKGEFKRGTTEEE